MTMQRTHVSARITMPSEGTSPDATIRDASSLLEASVTEWTADLCPAVSGAPATSQASLGYVDFDMVDSVHEPSAAGVADQSRR